MTAMWKKPALEQAQKRSPALDKAKQIAELKYEMKVLQDQLRVVRLQKDHLKEAATNWRQTAEDYRKGHDRYEFLREQELMVMNKDGAKYLKDEELDKYVDGLQGSISVDLINRLGKSYQQQLAASMAYTRTTAMSKVLGAPFTFTWDETDGSNP
jgi:hypothetical protein